MKLTFLFSLILFCQITAAQKPKELKAQWVTNPDITGQEEANILFRKTFNLSEKPQQFIINISADNHYTLFVNGQKVCFGPQLSDIRHWRYETVDIAKYLQVGKNCVAVDVMNYGFNRFFGMQSVYTALIVDGEGQAANLVNTNAWKGEPWKTLWNKSLKVKEVKWRVAKPDIIGGFYASQPTDSLDIATYPHFWQEVNYDDSAWKNAKFVETATAYGGGFAWLLEPRNVPLENQTLQRINKVVRTTGNSTSTDEFLTGKQPVTVAANSKATLWLDNSTVTIGYPELLFSSGKNAQIRISYAENLFNEDKSKGNRNDLTGKKFIGVTDVIVADGSVNRKFSPSFRRCFRFIQIDVITQDSPLVLNDYYNIFTITPITPRAKFSCDNPMYSKVFDICQRTAYICTQDYFLSDAYYETMQYVGDSKVHINTWQALTGDDKHTRNALNQFNMSRLPDGNLTSCYPLKSTFVHPNYSVAWVDMLYDYLKFSGDKDFTRKYLSGIRHTLDGFDALIQPNGLVGETKWEYFVDWYVDSRGGLPPNANRGVNSAVVTLQYVYCLQSAAKIFNLLGIPDEALKYTKRADFIKQKVYEQCYDASKGVFAWNPDKKYFDQHTNIMAILTDAVPEKEFKPILKKITEDEQKFTPATFFFRFYLFEALKKAKMSELFDLVQKPWEESVNLGMTTTLERFEGRLRANTRSEAHPWSTAPAYAYFTLLAGIEPINIGFEEIKIAPQMGNLQHIEGLYPTPKGDIIFKMDRKTNNKIEAILTVPNGMKGFFEWNSKKVILKNGEQRIEL
jgi:alpha-L-rhamnosidase